MSLATCISVAESYGGKCPYCAGKKSISPVHKKAVAILYQHKRWDSSKGYDCDIDIDFIVKALGKDCVYCGKKASNVDRIDCNKGHSKDNCVPCCGRCNMVRSNRIPYDIMYEVGAVFKRFGI